MKESFWGYWIVILGVFVVVIMMLISNVTTTNTQDYYLIKEVSEASMLDAVDYGYYRISGELRINADKFVESFIRRFSNSVELNTYTFDFYGIYEAPPKASVKVTTKSGTYSIGTSASSFDIVNRIDSILEVDGKVTGENHDKTQNSSSEGTTENTEDNEETEVLNQNVKNILTLLYHDYDILMNQYHIWECTSTQNTHFYCDDSKLNVNESEFIDIAIQALEDYFNKTYTGEQLEELRKDAKTAYRLIPKTKNYTQYNIDSWMEMIPAS